MTSKQLTKGQTSRNSGVKPSRGRPRDKNIEDRVFDSVIDIYSRGGWAVLTFEAIARESGVGKSSLYRRWADREELLHATLKARWLPVHKIDTGSLRGDLRELAEMIFNNGAGSQGSLENWLRVDSCQYPEVRNATAPIFKATILEARQMVRRAIKREEISSSLNPGLLMDLIVGGVNNHVITTPPSMRDKMIKKAPKFLDELVDVVLHGVSICD